jgi:hypothetical protein
MKGGAAGRLLIMYSYSETTPYRLGPDLILLSIKIHARGRKRPDHDQLWNDRLRPKAVNRE